MGILDHTKVYFFNRFKDDLRYLKLRWNDFKFYLKLKKHFIKMLKLLLKVCDVFLTSTVFNNWCWFKGRAVKPSQNRSISSRKSSRKIILKKNVGKNSQKISKMWEWMLLAKFSSKLDAAARQCTLPQKPFLSYCS